MLTFALLFNFACSDKTEDTAEFDDTGVETEETDTEDTSDTEDTEETDTEDTSDTEETDTEEPDATADYTVDSSDSTTWVYFNLNDGAIVPGASDSSTDWDIKMQRYIIALNSGVSGEGTVQGFAQAGSYDSYEDVSEVPADVSWSVDEPDSNNDGKPEYVLGGWFNYDFATHVLSPADVVYFVQTPDGAFKLRVVDYYNDVGESGFLSFDSELIAE